MIDNLQLLIALVLEVHPDSIKDIGIDEHAVYYERNKERYTLLKFDLRVELDKIINKTLYKGDGDE